jgi:hypothetical protein
MKKVISVLSLMFLALLLISITLVYAQGQNPGNQEQQQNQTQSRVQNQTQEKNKSQIKSRLERKIATFVPWQKRNESECLEGCVCKGAVVSCPTETGKVMTVEAGRSGNIITITVDKTKVNTSLELEQEFEEEKNKTRLRAKLSNGIKAEIKIMPNVASKKAIERLRLKVCSEENNCVIELKEVSGKKGNETKLAYEVQAERHARILFLFRKKMRVKAQIDAETGGIIQIKKPWWAFLALEPEE